MAVRVIDPKCRYIVDFEKKGNVIRFYLSTKEIAESKNYSGDDWNDAPYEHNAEMVFLSPEELDFIDIAYPLECAVMEPADGVINSEFSKNDFKERKHWCIQVKGEDYKCNEFVDTFYFGDEINIPFNMKNNHEDIHGYMLGLSGHLIV